MEVLGQLVELSVVEQVDIDGDPGAAESIGRCGKFWEQALLGRVRHIENATP